MAANFGPKSVLGMESTKMSVSILHKLCQNNINNIIVTKTHKRIKMCLYWHIHSCTICLRIIENGKWKIFIADISNYIQSSTLMDFENFIEK